MKQISLFILLSIAGINTCGAMSPKNAKINPAITTATSMPLAKPTLFFDITALNDKYETTNFNTVPHTARLVALGKSLEYNKWREQSINLTNQYNTAKTGSEREEIQRKINLNQEEDKNIYKKIKVIIESIAKKRNASAVISYCGYQENDTTTLRYIDPDYDITQEVFDTLNSEYNKNKPQKSTCNQSCCVHCPLKNTQH